MIQQLRVHLPLQGTHWSLVREDSTCCGKTKPMRHNYWARLLQLLKSAHSKTFALQHKKPPQWEAPAPQPDSSLHSPQLEKACAHQWWPRAVKINKYFKNSKWGFPDGARDKEPACQCMRHKRRGFDPWVGKIPWKRSRHPTLVFLPGESHGQQSLLGYSL